MMDAKPIPNLGERCAFIHLKASPGSVKKDGTFSSANRNSGSRQDAGTQAEGSECLQRLQTKSWLRPKTAHKKREKGLVGCRDMLNACSECCKTTENSRKCSLCRLKRFRLENPPSNEIEWQTRGMDSERAQAWGTSPYVGAFLILHASGSFAANVSLCFCTGGAIGNTGASRREALLLLRDMKTKYETLYKKTLEQAGSPQWHGDRAGRLWVFLALFVLEQHLDVKSSLCEMKVVSWLISHQSIPKNWKPQVVAAAPYGSIASWNTISVRISECSPDL